ncbi:MAG: alanine:cation symporter family protein [Pseudomonadales bacterium]|nr:alanine:cation symporter family protein [Gammaproteobacteria bacterium]MBP6052051.1 alanine:cation symporter family protein [Pseudomonadales bacterium]MBK6585247.1 alanine:cation symporter family protein [Gammaproteobacteria bacterium]MBK7520030.1 alanine:cation symporter family protein [Gammaproteobacteria bacterium]MBK8306254.1 alanine:cation symporter family protein [Gammaproteobacteria bacterium]
MRTRPPVMLAALLPGASSYADTAIDQHIADGFQPYADAVAGLVFAAIDLGGYAVPWILFWLIAAGAFCTIYFRFINLRGMRQGFRIIRGDYEDPHHTGDTSHFQALATALSGTVGLGNIAGVAVAITLGGPGAAFWMVIAALLGMATKFCECTLAVKYRRERPDGSVSGGPMYYLSRGIAANYPRLAPLGKVLGFTFAVLCLFGTIGAGNFFQVNNAYQQLLLITGGERSLLAGQAWLFGVVMAVLTGIVVLGGIKRIASVTDKLVPLMTLTYLVAALIVIGAHAEQIPHALGTILYGAFTPEGIQGGMVGALLQGFRRAAFSNEAGIGSAPIAHASVKTGEPLTEGLVALWEPFIDTVIICSLTALVIVISGAPTIAPQAEGVALTSAAFATVMPWFPYVLAVVVLMFAYSTMISYCYYGTKAANYLFGESNTVDICYKLFYLCATVVGVTMPLAQLVDFSDAIYFLMAVPNVIGLYLLAPVVKREMHGYFGRLSRGEIRSTREAPEHLIGSP